jgi:predicted TIM-barrel fold metal-dependent hydrolase
MANTTTVTQSAASTAVDEAVRIAAEGSRRTTQTAQAAVQASRKYVDLGAQINRDLVELWTASADAGLQIAFDAQNAALASAQTGIDSWASLSKDAFRRFADLTRQAQSVTLKSYESSNKLFQSLTLD